MPEGGVHHYNESPTGYNLPLSDFTWRPSAEKHLWQPALKTQNVSLGVNYYRCED